MASEFTFPSTIFNSYTPSIENECDKYLLEEYQNHLRVQGYENRPKIEEMTVDMFNARFQRAQSCLKAFEINPSHPEKLPEHLRFFIPPVDDIDDDLLKCFLLARSDIYAIDNDEHYYFPTQHPYWKRTVYTDMVCLIEGFRWHPPPYRTAMEYQYY
jgi:hypothetical protein